MMEAIRSYLTAVVAVSMIAVLASALAHGSRMERVVRFAAGLLALLVCVTPLLRLDARTLTDVLEQAERALDYDASGTDRTRQDMLRDLIRENTERTIEKQAAGLGKASKSGTDKSTAAEDKVRVGVIEIAKVLEEAETDG